MAELIFAIYLPSALCASRRKACEVERHRPDIGAVGRRLADREGGLELDLHGPYAAGPGQRMSWGIAVES